MEYVGLAPAYGPTFLAILGKLWFDEKFVKSSLSGYLFSGVTDLILLGSMVGKVINRVGDLMGKVGPFSPYITI